MNDQIHEERWQTARIAYKQKIRTAAWNSRYVSPEHNVDDMEQELLIVLWDSCRLYDPEKGMTFNSFFWMRAKQKIGMLQERAQAKKRSALMVSLDEEGITAAIDAVLQCASAEAYYEAHEAVQARRSQIVEIANHWRREVAATG